MLGEACVKRGYPAFEHGVQSPAILSSSRNGWVNKPQLEIKFGSKFVPHLDYLICVIFGNVTRRSVSGERIRVELVPLEVTTRFCKGQNSSARPLGPDQRRNPLRSFSRFFVKGPESPPLITVANALT